MCFTKADVKKKRAQRNEKEGPARSQKQMSNEKGMTDPMAKQKNGRQRPTDNSMAKLAGEKKKKPRDEGDDKV